MNKKFEAFDISEEDFAISKRSVLMLLDELIEEYSDFTNDVSPKNWRTTGHHITELKKMKDDIENRLTPITVEEKEIDWVKDARKEDTDSKKTASDNEEHRISMQNTEARLEAQLRAHLAKVQAQLRAVELRSKAFTKPFKENKNSMKHIRKFESFENTISHISELKIGDKILYQGSKCEVLTEDDFSVRVKSLQTDGEFTINQGQLQENGVRFA